MIKKLLNKINKNKFLKQIKRFKKLKSLRKKKGKKRKNLQLRFKKTKISKRNIIIILGVLLIFISVLALNLLKVDTISIVRKDSISNISIAYKATDRYRGKTLFLLKKEDIEENIKEYQKNIKDVSITRIPPSTLKIKIESYNPIFKTSINEKKYLLTENGAVIPTNKQNDDLKNLMLKIDSKINFPDYKQIFNSKFLKNISYIQEKLNDNLLSVTIKDINYYPTEREAHFRINNDTLLIFDINQNVDEQVEKILIFNKEYFSLAKSGMVYIDLRVKNKVFYCGIESEYKCNTNLEGIYSKQIKN